MTAGANERSRASDVEVAMRVIRTSVTLIVLGVLATATVGQETQEQPSQQQAPAPAPAPPSATPPADTPPASSGTQPAAPPRGGMRGDEFVPTQELQADEEATFPVDI
jgi:hypothetical protein